MELGCYTKGVSLDYGINCWGEATPRDGSSTFSSGRSCCSTSCSVGGAGPSGTHHGDTDDDNEEGTEDEESEYESSGE